MSTEKKIIKIVTAGHVDDGKSTLIGRLLYETKSLKDDQLQQIESKSKTMGYDYLDLSLATDGLLTEREQGITIDVSHIYFSHNQTRYVIADSPGHEEYTRNMVTGASNAHCALLLLDCRNGITAQTRRHLTILKLLNIKEIAVIINKIDLLSYSETAILEQTEKFNRLLDKFPDMRCTFIPISALYGDNVTTTSKHTSWYKGPTLLEYLESVPLKNTNTDLQTLFQVQLVLRPKTLALTDYRGYAGKVQSGTLSVGDDVKLFPSGKSSTIRQLEKYGLHVQSATQGENVTVLLEHDLDLSRGDTLYKKDHALTEKNELHVLACWMDTDSLKPGDLYTVQLGVNESRAKIQTINYEIDLTQQSHKPSNMLNLNAIGSVFCVLSQPLLVTDYYANQAAGSILFINEKTNATAGVGFVVNPN